MAGLGFGRLVLEISENLWVGEEPSRNEPGRVPFQGDILGPSWPRRLVLARVYRQIRDVLGLGWN
jgi:hypothetical protein